MIQAFQLTGFNPEQLATWDEAKVIAKHFDIQVDGKFVGGGLKPLTSFVPTSGIYLLTADWNPIGGPVPAIGKAKMYGFRFKNGFEGMNVGLVREKFKRYPSSPMYVLRELRREVEGV